MQIKNKRQIYDIIQSIFVKIDCKVKDYSTITNIIDHFSKDDVINSYKDEMVKHVKSQFKTEINCDVNNLNEYAYYEFLRNKLLAPIYENIKLKDVDVDDYIVYRNNLLLNDILNTFSKIMRKE